MNSRTVDIPGSQLDSFVSNMKKQSDDLERLGFPGFEIKVILQDNGLYTVEAYEKTGTGASQTNNNGSETQSPGNNNSHSSNTPPVIVIDPQNVHKKDRDLNHLHPIIRSKVKSIQKKLDAENIPMKAFEAYRSPERQAYLYAQGRTRPGDIVTKAKPWRSIHQYGLAVDFVRYENGSWNWNRKTSLQRKQWKRYHEIARSLDMEPLSWELPHVQLVGVKYAKLLNGDYPEGGDESWSENLAKAIARWSGSKKPPMPTVGERPPLEELGIEFSSLISPGHSDWHNRFGGDFWKYDDKGVYTRNHQGGLKLWRTSGPPITARTILTLFKEEILTASQKYRVNPALIVMTIATEAGAYRHVGFTGPKTFRWEQGYTVNATGNPALDGKEKGDYSAGPMQVLSDTARWMNDLKNLGYTSSNDFKFFKNKPTKPPATLGLYDPNTSIDVGTAYIAHNTQKTKDDPILVAAAYNAGSLKPSEMNHWRIHSYGNHLDRAAEWYGDACAVLREG